MSSQLQAMEATALNAVAALQLYEEDIRKLAATWLDMDLYQDVSQGLDTVQAICCSLPSTAVPLAALLSSHVEMMHCLWRSAQPDALVSREECTLRLREHLASIHSLSRQCLRGGCEPGRS